MDANSPSPIPPRAKHQPSKSVGTTTPVKGNNEQGAGNASSNRRGRNNRNRRQPSQQQQAPAWDDAHVTNRNDGYFDPNGNFVNGQPTDPQLSSADDYLDPSQAKSTVSRGPKNQRLNINHHSENEVSLPSNADVERMNQALRRNSPPVGNATPGKQLYAGPTFHASPAASVLPMPSFVSKSLPSVATSQPSLQSRLDQESVESEASNKDSPPPPPPDSKPVTSPPPRDESPLDFFFKADMEEKARRAAVSNGPATPNKQLAVPSFQSAPPQANTWAEIYGDGYRHHSRTASHDSQRGVFPLELDGTAVAPRQPASPPNDPSSSSAPPGDQQQSLRNFLHSTANGGSTSPQSVPSLETHLSGYSSDYLNSSPSSRRPPPFRSSSGPSTPAPHAQPNNPLHYGNRNLSPLFKAAGAEPIKRSSSSLRQELSSSPTANSVELPALHSPVTHQPPSTIRSSSYGNESNTASAPDVKSMENDLRRMLKINAFGGGAPGTGMTS